MHRHKLVHGDLKALNIVVDRLSRIRICDFGLTKLESSLTSTAMRGSGTAAWKAPELISTNPAHFNGESKTLASDVFAFGMIIYEVSQSSLMVINRVLKYRLRM